MSRASAAIDALRKRNPDAFRLAKAVSFALVVDRGLLRAARLELVREADAGTEADLWFSNLVKSRTADGIVLDPEAVEEIRARMTPAEIEAAWRVTSHEHEPWLAPSLLFEEEVAYLSVSAKPGARDRLVRRVQSVVRAMLRDDRPGLAQWASRALAMFPTSVRDLPETRMLDAGTRIRLGQGVETGKEWLPIVAPPSIRRTALQVDFRERELNLFAGPSGAPDAKRIEVPDTTPIVLDVSWEGEPRKQVVLRAGERIRVPVGSESVRITTMTGETFELSEAAVQTTALLSAVIDVSAELARHPTVIDRESELATLLSMTGIVRIGGESGIGKTAVLCELIRRLAPAPVFAHFFRGGDYTLGRISAAVRSIAAQIALRYRLESSVVDLPLSDVLTRLSLSPRCPPRLFIALDSLEEAHDEERNVPEDALSRILSSVPDFVTVYATSKEKGDVNLGPLRDAVAKQFGGREAWNSTIHDGVHALAAAEWPLPASLFADVLGLPGVVREGDLVSVLPGLFGSPSGHEELLARLERNRTLTAVRRYYALHAPSHLRLAGREQEAVRLCLAPTFMKEVVLFYDVALMKAHLRHAGPEAEAAYTAFEHEGQAIAANREELYSVLQRHAPGLVPPNPRLQVTATPDYGEWPSRRSHDGPVEGILNGPLGPMTWSADELLLGPPEGLPMWLFTATSITTVAARSEDILIGEASGFISVYDLQVPVDRREGHAGPVAGIVSAPGSSVFATWAADALIRLWSFARPAGPIDDLGGLAGHEDEITGCAFVGGDRLLVSSSRDGTIRTWSVAERRAIQVIRKDSPVTSLVVSSDGRWFAALDEWGEITIAPVEPSLASTVPLRSFRSRRTSGIALSPDDRYLAEWGYQGNGIICWDMLSDTLPPRQEMSIDTAYDPPLERCVFMSRDRLFIAWTNGGAALIDLNSVSRRIPLDTDGAVVRAFLDAPQTFYTGDERGRLIEWNKPQGERARDYSIAPDRVEAVVATTADRMAIVKRNGEVSLDGEPYQRFEMRAPRFVAGHGAIIVWSTQGEQWLFHAAVVDVFRKTDERKIVNCAIGLWGLRAIAYQNGDIEVLNERMDVVLKVPGRRVETLAFVANSSSLLFAERSSEITQLDIRTAKSETITASDRVVAIESGYGGNHFAAIVAPGFIDLYSKSALPPMRLNGRIDPRTGCRFGPNGEIIAATPDNTIAIWSSSGKWIAAARGHRARITGFDVAGDVIYSCSEDHTIRMWNIGTGEPLAVVYGDDAFRCISAAGVAGDDAGKLWRFRRQPPAAKTWNVTYNGADIEFVSMLKAGLSRYGIETKSTGDKDGLLVNETEAWVDGRFRVDFREWRDPYAFEAQLKELAEHLSTSS